MSPSVDCSATEFRAVVTHNCFWCSALPDQPIENGNDMASSQAAPSLDGETLAGEVIDDVENTEAPAT
jgi:hypothetical protein